MGGSTKWRRLEDAIGGGSLSLIKVAFITDIVIARVYHLLEKSAI